MLAKFLVLHRKSNRSITDKLDNQSIIEISFFTGKCRNIPVTIYNDVEHFFRRLIFFYKNRSVIKVNKCRGEQYPFVT